LATQQAAQTVSSDENAARAAEPANSDDARMSFVEHLSELRLRLRNAAIIFLVVMLVSFGFVK
jgi:Sec-independent protein secretion pathway component TatC